MMRKFLAFIVVVGLVGFGVFWFITQPKMLSSDDLAGTVSDPEAGEYAFYAGGCASCHSAPEASGDQVVVPIPYFS